MARDDDTLLSESMALVTVMRPRASALELHEGLEDPIDLVRGMPGPASDTAMRTVVASRAP